MAMYTAPPMARRTNRPVSRPPSTIPPPRRTTRGASKPASRFSTPARAVEHRQSAARDVSVVSGMDVDDGALHQRGIRPDTVFAQSNEMLVAFHAHLPAEVKQILRTADFFRDAYTGRVDTLTGFALVATSLTCFVWQHSQALAGTPTCYIFSCPIDYSQNAPLHAFVPYGASREPGLILLSSSGDIRFWDSIGIGLAGGDRFSTTQLELEPGESTTSLTRSDPQTYVASTSNGRLFRFTLTSTGGKYHLTSRLFSHPHSSLSLTRFFPSLWAAPILQPEAGNIIAVALGTKNNLGTDVWALIDSRIQQWNMSSEGWEEIILEEDLMGIIRPALQESISPPSTPNAYIDIELLDLVVESSESLVFLTSHSGAEDDLPISIGPTPRRIYSLIQVSVLAGTLKVENVMSVPYQSTFGATEAPMQPQLQLIPKDALLVVHFGDAITICAKDTEYKDRIRLKSAADRMLGVGIVSDQSELLVLTAATVMKATVDSDKVANFDPATGRSTLIQSIMSQAIKFGSLPENPLHFSFPPEIDEDSLMSGAEQLSRAILESDHLVVQPNDDLTSQMTTRKERLSFLIKFINENGVLGKISQRSRQRLATDAEKLYAAQQLWQTLNDYLSNGSVFSVLKSAIYVYMNSTGEGHHVDFLRAFFRLRIDDLGRLLPYVMDITRKSIHEAPAEAWKALREANSVVLLMLNSAFEYREYNGGVYGIELPFIKPWTSRLQTIDIAIELFDTTTALVEAPGKDISSRSTSEPRSQLPELASVIFASMTERLDWLKSSAISEEQGKERERLLLDDRFRQLRPEVLDTLRRNGFGDHAFQLAEKYRDFRSLASLCNKDAVYPLEANPHANSIHAYIEKFRDEFTEELYHWYIEHGELRAMIAHEDAYGDYVDRYFAKFSHPSISWIRDMGKRRWSAASETLLSQGQDAGDLSAKALMLSIGKLSHLAHLQESGTKDEENLLESFHDGLDFVSVHESLVAELKEALSPARGKQSIDAQAETILKAKASKLADKRSLPLVFKQLVRELLRGNALTVEDAADVLSLKDNVDTIEDYATALHLLSCARNLPEGRRLTAFRAVWRRIYAHDDWDAIRQTAGITDEVLNERFRSTALYTALSATFAKQHTPPGYILTPSQALGSGPRVHRASHAQGDGATGGEDPAPDLAEIAARWSGMAPKQVEALAEDYRDEARRVEALGLEDVYERTKELVMVEFLSV